MGQYLLRPGVAYTTGLSHNSFIYIAPALRSRQKSSVIQSYVKLLRHPPVKRTVFPTIPLLYAKDQCEFSERHLRAKLEGTPKWISKLT